MFKEVSHIKHANGIDVFDVGVHMYIKQIIRKYTC